MLSVSLLKSFSTCRHGSNFEVITRHRPRPITQRTTVPYVIFNVDQTHSLMTLQKMSFCLHSSVHCCSTTAAMLPSLSMWEHPIKWLSSTNDSIHQRSPFRSNFCAESDHGKSDRLEIRSLFSACSPCTEATQLFIPTRKCLYFLTSSPCRRR